MTYISIDTKTKQAKKLVEFIETLPFTKVLKEPNTTTKKAIDDARKGKTHKAKSLDQLFIALKNNVSHAFSTIYFIPYPYSLSA